ncbi:hypothetical protein L1987_57392 [Smallanthus sonchifolius]|uniref:Uncharacterized protein n=1 Tax=Smallanthus sonchifolius TaxID=185202 RepID=A0ACB9DCW4_9ASTR|nr:hypothetical protein L1987_57392 [Smallanthus sonchifolius]
MDAKEFSQLFMWRFQNGTGCKSGKKNPIESESNQPRRCRFCRSVKKEERNTKVVNRIDQTEIMKQKFESIA